MNEEILLKLIIGPVFIGIIAILLILFALKKRKQVSKIVNKVDYGKVYYKMVLTTSVAMIILCDNIYKFLLFQCSLIFAAILISRDINNNLKY